MSSFKEKTQMFALGLLVGLVAAGSFFIFKLDEYFQKLKHKNPITTYYYYKDKKSSEGSVSDKDKKDSVTDVVKAEKGKKNNKTQTEKKIQPIIVSDDSLSLEESIDTTTVVDENVEEQEEIVVEKEELLKTLKLFIVNLNTTPKADQIKDSLLQKVSGIKEDKNLAKKEIVVELWKSPLHFKGYKMSKNKLVLYGLVSIDGIKAYKLDGKTYIKTASLVYEMEETYDYKPFKMISNAEITEKLKQP